MGSVITLSFTLRGNKSTNIFIQTNPNVVEMTSWSLVDKVPATTRFGPLMVMQSHFTYGKADTSGLDFTMTFTVRSIFPLELEFYCSNFYFRKRK